ncbi:TetR/AcrR family transcriptional regulator [Pelagicoccus sp. SDUM812003]|uniref:TetR/AcrR family transcriptional regulator n=1 Tax=Pelagicoccus sp. SDUM812003 TaxID=3041267 RepID=UPI00280F0393|nr:TetR/AcrR family transcriptional regulator [Pelagicoccus sp. SDUM812003]MDQ8202919.1 TetR/AcrR family transcriptional regulator [Pelagicoccus sp. SDUM812003]
MKEEVEKKQKQRSYRQRARARASAETARTIVTSFLKRLGDQWYEDITLDSVAQDANVTVQTVIRRFGGKTGLLEAAIKQLGDEIAVRRPVRQGDVDFTVKALADDYESVGDLILRFLNQEDRHEAIQPVVEKGRHGHREWLESVFTNELTHASPAKRRKRLDALVVATDLYVWKLLRRDMKRPVSEFKNVCRTLIHAALEHS